MLKTATRGALSESELDDRYQEFLREIYGESVEICGYNYDTPRALNELDPTAYRCGFSDWLDSELTAENLFEKHGEYFNEAQCEHEDDSENGHCISCGEFVELEVRDDIDR